MNTPGEFARMNEVHKPWQLNQLGRGESFFRVSFMPVRMTVKFEILKRRHPTEDIEKLEKRRRLCACVTGDTLEEPVRRRYIDMYAVPRVELC